MPTRLLIADAHVLVREGLRDLLRDADVVVVAEAAAAEEAVRLSRQSGPEVALLEIFMSGGDGFEALSGLKTECPNVSILMFSAYDNPAFIARAFALGAAGYLLKSASGEAIVQAIHDVAAGRDIWSRETLRRVTGTFVSSRIAADVEVSLTQRETEVLGRLAEGLTNKDIARALRISYETVKEHVQHILFKIGVADRTQAAIWAVRKGIV